MFLRHTTSSFGTLRSTLYTNHHKHSLIQPRTISTLASTFKSLVSSPSSTHQLYLSTSHDPYLNLSIEHYLLQHTPATSTVLFLYTNRPCVVFGRNQNPWLETNLHLLSAPSASAPADHGATEATDQTVDLVRRRSGGGTVFHDLGNLNYSVICPPDAFTRDKHAEMVVRAIRPHNPRARVNDRHDIVLDQGPLRTTGSRPAEAEYHDSKYEPETPLKCSGSAYKLTKNRALHHGTCLVNSENVGGLGKYLRGPAGPWVKARGVDSVRSKVGNVFPEEREGAVAVLRNEVVRAFAGMYGLGERVIGRLDEERPGEWVTKEGEVVCGRIGEGMEDVEEIWKGVRELNSPEWVFCQTPQFVLSTRPTEDDPRARPRLPESLLPSTHINIKARFGAITEATISTSADDVEAAAEASAFFNVLKGRKIHEIRSWSDVLTEQHGPGGIEGVRGVGSWLDEMLGGKGKAL